jgi:hypothetical protein
MPTSIHKQALDAIVSIIQGLTLLDGNGTQLPTSQVYSRKLPTDRGLVLPAVICSLVPIPETIAIATNAQDDIGYPVMVTVVAANNQDLTVEDWELTWRQTIRDTFRNKRPADLVSALSQPLKWCLWEPAPVLDNTLFQQANLFVSAAVIRVVTREAR